MISPDRSPRPFRFERDTFAFAHELVWQYRFDSSTRAMSTIRSDPPPTYYHRCFVMTRSARQFLYHGQFEPGLLVADAQTYRRKIGEVVSRSPRWPSGEAERIVIPGYDCLRAFSEAQEPLLKAECGSAWESYMLRSHWRMVFPVWRGHQARVARQLVQSLRERSAPIVHLFRFPHVTINHGIVLFNSAERDGCVEFEAYDPNIPDHPVTLSFNRASQTFSFPRNHYWAGGRLSVIEIYCGGLY
jgi:hypothetical protein